MRSEIVNIRIDERLIHGQVAAAWTKYLKATRLMVIDADAASSDLQKVALKMACPQGVKLSILSPARAVEKINGSQYAGERVFIVVKGTETLKTLHDCGLEMDSVNVGNMSGKDDTRFIKKAVNITGDDEKIFRSLAPYISFTAQLVPTEPVVDFIALLG